MIRNRALTEQRLIDAVGKIVAEDGMTGVRINRVAGRASVNKILIYRYFGNLNGLREAYIRQLKPIISLPPLDVDALRNAPLDVMFDTCCTHLLDEYRLLRQNPQAQGMLRASLLDRDDVANALAIDKTRDYQIMVHEMADLLGTRYGRSFSTLVNSSLTFLTLLSHQQRSAFGIDLDSEMDWDDIETSVRLIFRGLYLYTKERQEQDVDMAVQLPG